MCRSLSSLFFFFNDPATTEIYTLSLHDALPISPLCSFTRNAPSSLKRAYPSSLLLSSGEEKSRSSFPFERLSWIMRSHSRSEEHTSELQSQSNLVCRLLLEKKKKLTLILLPALH